jgi:hypothetical protein
MRKQLVALTFAGMALLPPAIAAAPAAAEEAASTNTTVAVQRVALRPSPMRDEAAMVLIGTGLIALAGAVRRASPNRPR